MVDRKFTSDYISYELNQNMQADKHSPLTAGLGSLLPHQPLLVIEDWSQGPDDVRPGREDDVDWQGGQAPHTLEGRNSHSLQSSAHRLNPGQAYADITIAFRHP